MLDADSNSRFCVRDVNGRFVCARTETRNFIPVVHEGEAIALAGALEWLKNKCPHNVEIEVNCQRISNSVNKEHIDSSGFGEIIRHGKSLLKSSLLYKVCFTPRQTNLIAHLLARASRSYTSFQDFETHPTCIID